MQWRLDDSDEIQTNCFAEPVSGIYDVLVRILQRAAVRKYVFTGELKTHIVKHRLGDSADVLGAALVGV
jgi:hypothetical protein